MSYGGGTQSAALALMAAAGQLEPLDAVIFADTAGELPETYAFAEYVREALELAGIPFLTVSAGSLEAALLSPVRTASNPTPPAHVLNPSGSKGRIGAYRCSYDYKRRVVEAEVKRRCGGPGAWKRSHVEQWLGFSTDEVSRCRQADVCRCGHKRMRPDYPDGRRRGHAPACTDCACEAFDPWQINRWPLLELGYRRSDTIAWFGRNGHPVPPRSACWFCPNQGNARWRELRDRHPELWDRAVTLDAHIRNGAGFNARGNQPFAGQMFLHASLRPLPLVDLRSSGQRALEDDGQPGMFDEEALTLGSSCSDGACFT